MKFLCLHGNGSNSTVMQQQMGNVPWAGLRYELEGDHEYEFVEGVMAGPMADDVTSLATPDQSFYYYWDPDTFEFLPPSLAQLDTYIRTEGPFDVIVAFSAGALLVATYLLSKKAKGEPLPFQSAIFICTAGRLHEAAKVAGLDLDLGPTPTQGQGQAQGQEQAQEQGQGTETSLINLPTVHIRGEQDHIEPTGSQDLARLCDPSRRDTVVHPGGHEFPKAVYLTQSVHAIRRAIDP